VTPALILADDHIPVAVDEDCRGIVGLVAVCDKDRARIRVRVVIQAAGEAQRIEARADHIIEVAGERRMCVG
jgi:hypothetical protein